MKSAGPRTGETISSSIRQPVNHASCLAVEFTEPPDRDKILTSAIQACTKFA